MGISKGTAKWLKVGAGAAALGISFTNPIGWCADLTGGAAIASSIASGVVMGAVGHKVEKTADKAIDKNTDKGGKGGQTTAKDGAKSEDTTSASSDLSKNDAQEHGVYFKNHDAPHVAASNTNQNAANGVSSSASYDVNQTSASGNDAATGDSIVQTFEKLLGLGGGATNQNGQSVGSTFNKFVDDSNQVQANSGKNLQQAANHFDLTSDDGVAVER